MLHACYSTSFCWGACIVHVHVCVILSLPRVWILTLLKLRICTYMSPCVLILCNIYTYTHTHTCTLYMYTYTYIHVHVYMYMQHVQLVHTCIQVHLHVHIISCMSRFFPNRMGKPLSTWPAKGDMSISPNS